MGFNIARKLSDCKYFYNIYLYILVRGYQMIAKTCEKKYLRACSQRSFIFFVIIPCTYMNSIVLFHGRNKVFNCHW